MVQTFISHQERIVNKRNDDTITLNEIALYNTKHGIIEHKIVNDSSI